MPEKYFDRRSVLRFAGASVVGGTLASGVGMAAESLDEQLARVEQATKKYEDPQTALDDGFMLMGPFVPGMGWHFVNLGRVGDPLDIEKPELLTYDDSGGNLKLGAVEYALPVGVGGHDEDTPPDLFDDEGGEHWHIHPAAEHTFSLSPEVLEQYQDPKKEGTEIPSMEEVDLEDQIHSSFWAESIPGTPGEPRYSAGEVIVSNVAGGGIFDQRTVISSSSHPDLWTLHAWVHKKNPDGVFDPRNKTLSNAPRR